MVFINTRRVARARFTRYTFGASGKNRVTYSVLMQKLAPDSVTEFVRAELDKVALAHSTFTDDALSLIVRSSEGVLRRARNLCLSALLDAVRGRTKNRRPQAGQPWRREVDLAQ